MRFTIEQTQFYPPNRDKGSHHVATRMEALFISLLLNLSNIAIERYMFALSAMSRCNQTYGFLFIEGVNLAERDYQWQNYAKFVSRTKFICV